jgi:hypothetical protein
VSAQTARRRPPAAQPDGLFERISDDANRPVAIQQDQGQPWKLDPNRVLAPQRIKAGIETFSAWRQFFAGMMGDERTERMLEADWDYYAHRMFQTVQEASLPWP